MLISQCVCVWVRVRGLKTKRDYGVIYRNVCIRGVCVYATIYIDVTT